MSESAATETWWREKEFELAEIDNAIERGRTMVCGRQYEPGRWEYAIVRWWYRSPRLLCHIRDGIATEFGE